MFSALCWSTYFFTYFGRYSFVSGMSALVAGQVLSKTQAGMIGAAFYFPYAVTQFLVGLVGDSISPRRLVFLGVMGSAACNLLFPLYPGFSSMFCLWCVNGAFQGLIWPLLIRACADLLEGNQCVQVSVDMASSSPVSMVTVYLLSALGLTLLSWRFLFVLSGVVMGISAAVWLAGMGSLEKQAGGMSAAKGSALLQEKAAPNCSLWGIVLASGLMCAAIASVMNGALKDGMFTWVPTYLMENHGIPAERATLLTTVIPVVNLAGVYLAKEMNRRLFHNEEVTSAVLYGATVIFLAGMFLPGGTLWAVAMFALSTTMMMGANTALVGIIPLHFRQWGRVAAITGLLNTCVHVGGALASYGFGSLSDAAGWNALRLAWCLCALLGGAGCLLHSRQWKMFRAADVQ